MVNYYHRFIPHCAAKLTPLNTLFTAANEGHTDLGFIESKQIFANVTLLVHPDHSAPLNITCDASNFAVGGVLQQYIDNVLQRSTDLCRSFHTSAGSHTVSGYSSRNGLRCFLQWVDSTLWDSPLLPRIDATSSNQNYGMVYATNSG